MDRIPGGFKSSGAGWRSGVADAEPLGDVVGERLADVFAVGEVDEGVD